MPLLLKQPEFIKRTIVIGARLLHALNVNDMVHHCSFPWLMSPVSEVFASLLKPQN